MCASAALLCGQKGTPLRPAHGRPLNGVDLIMGREEPLHLAGGLEPLHPPLAPSCRLVRVLGPVVQALVPAVLDPGHQVLLRRRMARQLVRDHDARRPALALEELA